MSYRRLFSVGFANGIVALARMLFGLLTNKMYALLLGPAGYAVLGNVTNVFILLYGIAQGGISTGVTTCVARKTGHKEALTISRNASLISCIIAFLTGILFILGLWSTKASHLQIPLQIILFLYMTLILAAPFGALVGYYNGLETNRPVYIAFVFGACMQCFGVAICYVLGSSTWMYATPGLSMLGSTILLLLITKSKLSELAWPSWQNLKFDFKRLKSFVLIGMFSGVVSQFMLIAVRCIMTRNYGEDLAGNWQASWRLSEVYLSILVQTISMVLLPRYSRAITKETLHKEILWGLRVFGVAALLFSITMYFISDSIIPLLFSARFSKTASLMKVQVIGDFLKIISWVFSYVMLAHGKTNIFILMEVLSGVFFVLLAYLLSTFNPSIYTANIAYVVMYLAYLIGTFLIAITIVKSLSNKKVPCTNNV